MPGDEQFFFARQVLKMQIVEFTERFRLPDRPPAQREFERIVPSTASVGGGRRGPGGARRCSSAKAAAAEKPGRAEGKEGTGREGGREGGNEDIGSISETFLKY